MSTTEAPGGDPGEELSEEPEHSSAREFAEYRLEDIDGTLSPSEMADEYGCTPVHMRKTLTEMMDEGTVERPTYGEYALADTADSARESTESSVGGQGSEADTEADGEDAGDMRPSAGGGPRSEDRATEVEEDRESGIGIPREVAVVAVVVVLAVAYWRLKQSRDQGGQEPADEQEAVAAQYTRGD